MRKLTAGHLRNRVGVHSGKQVLQENGEINTIYSDEPDRYIWAKLVPCKSAAEPLNGGGEIIEITHKCYVRAASLKDIKPDMFLAYRGQRYNILSYMPYYQQPGWLELSCVMVIEQRELFPIARGTETEYEYY